MSDPFLGEIKAVGFNYAPLDWAKCAGQQMNINQNQALYALLGLLYGGDLGRGYFNLPNLQGRCAIGSGSGVGLTPRVEGQFGGAEKVALTIANLPAHNHAAAVTGTITASINAVDDAADVLDPNNAMIAKAQAGGTDLDAYYKKEPVDVTKIKPLSNKSINVTSSGMNVAISNTGTGQIVNIMPPYLVVNYIIALSGIFPARN